MLLRAILGIISLIADIVFLITLRIDIYTDRANMPDGTVKEWQWSPSDRLDAGGRHELIYVQLFFAAVSIITSILLVFGVRNSYVRIVQLISTAVSVVMFIIIMIIGGKTHPRY